jgi:hypothetical protein
MAACFLLSFLLIYFVLLICKYRKL